MKQEDFDAALNSGKEFIQSLGFVKTYSLIGSGSYLPDDAEDVDFLVLLPVGSNAVEVCDRLILLGWEGCGDDYEGMPENNALWKAIRRGPVNVMFTHDEGLYKRFVAATEVCKFLKLKDKGDRIAVCQIVREGIDAVMARNYLEWLAAKKD